MNVMDVAVLLGALAMMMDPLRKLSSVNNMIQSSMASAERVFEFIDAKSDILEAPDAMKSRPCKDAAAVRERPVQLQRQRRGTARRYV